MKAFLGVFVVALFSMSPIAFGETILFEDSFETCCSIDPTKWSDTSGWSRTFSSSAADGNYHAQNSSSATFNNLRTIDLAIPAEGAVVNFSYDSFTRFTELQAKVGSGSFSPLYTAPATGTAGPQSHSFTVADIYAGQNVSFQWVKQSGSTDSARVDDVKIAERELPPFMATLFEDSFETCCGFDPNKWSDTSGWSRSFSPDAADGIYHAQNTSSVPLNHLRTIELAIPADGAVINFSYDSMTRSTELQVKVGSGSFTPLFIVPATGNAGPQSHSFTIADTYAGQNVSFQWVKQNGTFDFARVDDVRIMVFVPEPTSLLLFQTALLLPVFARRRL